MLPPAAVEDCGGKLEETHKGKTALSAARLADAEQLAHDQAQVAGGDVRFVSLVDLFDSPLPRASRSARFTDVGETSLDEFAPFLLQPLAAVPPHPPPVGVNGLLIFERLVGPATFVR